MNEPKADPDAIDRLFEAARTAGPDGVTVQHGEHRVIVRPGVTMPAGEGMFGKLITVEVEDGPDGS